MNDIITDNYRIYVLERLRNIIVRLLYIETEKWNMYSLHFHIYGYCYNDIFHYCNKTTIFDLHLYMQNLFKKLHIADEFRIIPVSENRWNEHHNYFNNTRQFHLKLLH